MTLGTILRSKKVLLSIGVLVATAGVLAAATGAFFSDTEQSTGNTFTAGTIDLKIDSVQHYRGMVCAEDGDSYVWAPVEAAPYDTDQHPVLEDNFDADAWNTANPAAYPQAGEACTGSWRLADIGDNEATMKQFFMFDDVKPGDYGENTISLHVETNDAYMCVAVDNVSEADNGQTEPEAAEDTDGDDGAELDDELYFMAWVDEGATPGWQGAVEDPTEGDNVYQDGERSLGSARANELTDTVWALAEGGDDPIMAGTTGYIGLSWCVGEFDNGFCDGASVGNASQGDSWMTDLVFYIEQARNNSEFSCSDFRPDSEEEVLTATESDGWSSVDLAGKTWFAKAKVQETDPASDFEVQVGVGDSNPADFDSKDTEYVDAQVYPFTLVYDGAGNADFTIDGETASYAVGSTSVSNIGITINAPVDSTTSVDSLVLNTGSLSDDAVSVSDGTRNLTIAGATLDAGFTLTGNVTFDWDALTANGENQKMQISFN